MFDQFFYFSRVIKSDYRNIPLVKTNQPTRYHFIIKKNLNKFLLRILRNLERLINRYRK